MYFCSQGQHHKFAYLISQLEIVQNLKTFILHHNVWFKVFSNFLDIKEIKVALLIAHTTDKVIATLKFILPSIIFIPSKH